jgi:CRP/FNR family cyclic AMP-dependent transcriptional regulator
MAIGGRVILDDPAVVDALSQSHLRDLPAGVLRSLLEGAARIQAPAGSTVREFGEPGPYLELLVEGFLRVFVRAPDGRSLTVRYLRRGELAGVVSLFTPQYSLAATVQALVDSDLIRFHANVVIGLAERDLRVARAMIDELSDRVVNFVAEIPGTAFTTVRQRVARHLLDLASEQPLATGSLPA